MAKKNSQLAEVNELLQMLRPEINSPITRKIVSNLRSKISLKKFSSKKQLSKINLNHCFLTSQISEVKS